MANTRPPPPSHARIANVFKLPRSLRPHLSFFAPALLVDYATIIIIEHISHYVEHQYPYIRDAAHYLGDIDLTWPHTVQERVPVHLLFQLAFWLPFGVTVVLSLARRSIHEAHHSILALWTSYAIMRISVEWIKNRVGRLRPDFLARCAYDVFEKQCTGLEHLVKDGRRSFPSGHSATAWQGLFFLTLFLAGKNGAFAFNATFPRSGLFQSRLLRFSIAVSPLFLAAWIAITRIEDHMHHPTDVLAGSTIGAASAFIAYLIYFPNPFDSAQLGVMDKAKLVYGEKEKEDDEGRIALALAGEEEGEGLLSGRGVEEV